MAEPALAYSPPPCPALDAILALDEDSLPYTDDTPMPDGRIQQGPLDYSREGIRYHLRDKRDHMAVDSDMFVYYIGRDRRGQPIRASVAPDVFVVFGVPDRPDRKSYVLWREPDAKIRFVLEIASPSTRTHDHTVKRDVYASLGVREYFLFEPANHRRPAAVLGLRLRGGRYEEVPPEDLPNGRLGVPSEVIGLVPYVNEEGNLRWFDPAAGDDLPTYNESEQRRQTAERQHAQTARTLKAQVAAHRQAERKREQAEARVAELEALLRRREG